MTSQLSSLAKALCGSDFNASPPHPKAEAGATASVPVPPFVISQNTMDVGMLTCCEVRAIYQ